MEWHLLPVVYEKTIAASSYGNLLVSCTLVDKPLPLTESLMSRKASEFSEIS